MSKPYTEADFSAQISADRAWRIKEVSDLKTAIQRSDAGLQRVLLRALVALSYAHWEGGIRFAATKYLQHVALRKFQYSELNRQFVRNYFLPRLAALSIAKTSIKQRCDLVDDILGCSTKRFANVNDDLVRTGGNLNFDVFTDICLVCGVAIEPFADRSKFLDVLLLKRRNEIAHGEETFVEVGGLDEIADTTISLLRQFGDALENHVYSGTYKAA